MKTFEMRLEDIPFQATVDGRKTIEVRLCDERRKNIAAGDIVKFLRTSDKKPLLRKVLGVRNYHSLQELVDSEQLESTGQIYRDTNHWFQEISRYYSNDLQKKYGLIVIEMGEISG